MSESDGSAQPGDTMRERVDESRLKLWILMEANRWLVAAVILLAVFAALVVLGVLDPSPLQQYIGPSDDAVDTVFQGFVGAIITGVTLVVTLNQLVLSQELGPVGDQQSRMEGAMQFRREVEDALDVPTAPPEPASFMQALLEETKSRANALADAVDESRDEDLKDEIGSYVDGLTGNADEVSDTLEDTQFGTFDVLSAILNFNYSWKIFLARKIRNEHADALTDEVDEAFDDIIESLTFFGPSREHFKTLYFQWELVNLSRAMLYTAVPALVVTISMIIYFDAKAIPGSTFGISNDVLTVSLASTIAIVPFIILLSYILRIATVAKRTLSIGPFILRETKRSDELD
ncbi:hypothetical protein ZOD2009_03270 [Haladaptatus paucihalophilus DX253]|uniref:Uncharacterized protein n=1 Tax=Haladaptatus paucihalophilus DX253 TaxID=797209 RepID=E7QPH0_HALPU|nr:hypothetical protein [Haladaptatus paucihalophilus]EFW94131.1 hypothetical protein ZOD2009_03270 [Haladaptatus paucihalophilus DX253]SHK60828.1 hypothetical protein SAMN05444342_1838 [Haladaptatus paucihalophilus DX253]